MEATDSIFYIAILIISVVVHEISHGFMAECFGDRTARYAGRLTLNPIRHLDLFGSIILPILLVWSHSPFLFGWAKPVPYNPNNLSNRKTGTLAIAVAGVLSNFFIAVIFGIIIRSLIVLPLNYYYAIPIWTGMTAQQAISAIPWWVIAGFNAIQGVLDVVLAWILVFRFRLHRFANWT